MKKVFLSLAVVAVLTVVSCKKTETAPEGEVAADTTAVAPADTTAAVAADTTAAAPADTTAAAPAATPAK